MSQLIRLIPLCLAYVTTAASAGVLTLTNGDRVYGELVIVERERVVWLSENFGEIEIAKAKILSVDTDTELKIAGREEPCALVGHRRQQWELYCDKGPGWMMDFPAIERAEPYAHFSNTPIVHHGRVIAAGEYKTGNNARTDWDLNGRFELRYGDIRHLLEAVYESEDTTATAALRKYQLNYDLRWVFAEKWFAAGSSELLRENERNLNLGTKVGLDLGYLFYDTGRTAFSVQGGLRSVNEDFIDRELSEEGEKRYLAGQTAASYRYKFSLGPEVYVNPELLQSFADSEDFESSIKLGVRTPLIKDIVLDINYLWEYDRTPSLENDREDTQLSIGVGYEW